MDSVENRKLLLAGLLDTDGYSSPKNGMVEFCNTNERLAKQVQELACSLGYKAVLKVGDATLYGKFVSKKYRVTFMPHTHVFLLDRKNKNIRIDETSKRSMRRFIVSIEEVAREPVQCLVVDDPDHQFLITRSFIATHNSSLIGSLMYGLFNGSDREGITKNGQIMNQNKKNCSASVYITANGEDYLIERSSNRAELPKRTKKKEDVENDKTETKLNFWKVLPSGEKESKNGISRDETDKIIRKLLGTPQDFLMTSVATQRRMEAFINEGAAGRKAILNRFLDLDIFERLHSFVKEDLQTLNAKLAAFPIASEEQEQTLQANLLKAKENLEMISGEISTLQETIFQLRGSLQQLEATSDQDLQTELRGIIAEISKKETQLSRAEETRKTLQNSIGNIRSNLDTLRTKLAGIDPILLKKEAEEMAKLQKKLDGLQMKFREMERETQTKEKSIKKLTLVPCGDSFPTCQYIKDSHEDKQKLPKLKEDLMELTKELESATTLFAEMQKANHIERLRLSLEAQDRVSSWERELVEKTAQVASLDTTISSLSELLQRLGEQRDKLSSRLPTEETQLQLMATRKQLKELSETIKSKEQTKASFLVQIGSMQTNLERIQSTKEHSKELNQKAKILESIQAAFHKNGIPAIVLKTQLPAINQELSTILGGLVDFNISFDTDPSSSSMDVWIEDEHSKRILELGSGMEQMMASIAIRVALINVSGLPKSDIFVIDEGFNALDEEHVGKCLELLQNLKDHFKTVLIISHMQRVKDAADAIIEVVSDGKDSRISA